MLSLRSAAHTHPTNAVLAVLRPKGENLRLELSTEIDSAVCISKYLVGMELGSGKDPSKATFSFVDEDHTLANAVRFSLNQDPRTSFCGYSIPHPSDARVNIRVQTTGDPAREVLKDACQNLMAMCGHVRTTFDKSVADTRRNNPTEVETNSDGA